MYLRQAYASARICGNAEKGILNFWRIFFRSVAVGLVYVYVQAMPAGSAQASPVSQKSNTKFKHLPPPRCGLPFYIDQRNFGEFGAILNFWRIFFRSVVVGRYAVFTCMPAGQTHASAVSQKSNKKFKHLPPPRCGLPFYIDQRNFGEFGAILNFWRIFSDLLQQAFKI